MNAEVLNSWKEIAAYLGRGVRTVQRWEQELGLPVRRPRGKERSAVIALKPDIDHWLHRVPQGPEITHAGAPPVQKIALHVNAEQMMKRTHEILERSLRMQEMVRNTLALTTQLKKQQAEGMAAYKLTKTGHHTTLAKTVSLGLELHKLGAADKAGANPSKSSADEFGDPELSKLKTDRLLPR